MTRLTLHGTPVYTEGTVPAVGHEVPRLTLTSTQLTDVSLDHYGPGCKVLNIVPSLELPSFDAATRRLSDALRAYSRATLITVSQDLPFANTRFDTGHSVVLSSFRCPKFARAFGLEIISGPLKGLMAPAVFVLDGQHRVVHVELLREMSGSPDHAALLAAVRQASSPRATTVAATPVAPVACQQAA